MSTHRAILTLIQEISFFLSKQLKKSIPQTSVCVEKLHMNSSISLLSRIKLCVLHNQSVSRLNLKGSRSLNSGWPYKGWSEISILNRYYSLLNFSNFLQKGGDNKHTDYRICSCKQNKNFSKSFQIKRWFCTLIQQYRRQ